MQTNSIIINFNDELYQETGIRHNSVRQKEYEIQNDKGLKYQLQVSKKNSNGKETMYFALKDIRGLAVEDVVIRVGRKTYTLSKKKSQDAAVVEVGADMQDTELDLTSASTKIAVAIKIKMEKPRAIHGEDEETNKATIDKKESRKNKHNA